MVSSILFSVLVLGSTVATASVNPLVCANLFREAPHEIHPIVRVRAISDARLGVRRYDNFARLAHRVTAENGLLYYRGELLDTSRGTADGVHRRGIQILALDRDMNLITTEHAPVHVIHHSTLTGGEPGYYFGEWKVRQGKVVMVSNMSGHFLPSVAQLHVFVQYLRELGVLHPNVDIVEIRPDFSVD